MLPRRDLRMDTHHGPAAACGPHQTDGPCCHYFPVIQRGSYVKKWSIILFSATVRQGILRKLQNPSCLNFNPDYAREKSPLSTLIMDMHDGDAPTSNSMAGTQYKRPRSSIACCRCRERKVRCDASISGLPCTNCTLDQAPCNLLPGRKRSR